MYRIINDSCLKKDLLDEESIDITITSPPYNLSKEYGSNDDLPYEEYLDFSKKWMENVYYWSKQSGRFLLNIPLDTNRGGKKSIGADLTVLAKEIGWNYYSTIIWAENNISKRTAWGSWLRASAPCVIAPVELIVILYKGEWKKTEGTKISSLEKEEFMEWTNGLWRFNGESAKRVGHPAPFPRELPKRCIKLFSYVDDIVLDPFLGSGSTLIESEILERQGVGIEISEEYCKLSKKRIDEASKKD